MQFPVGQEASNGVVKVVKMVDGARGIGNKLWPVLEKAFVL